MRLSWSFMLLFVAVPLAAQVDRATLNGTVTDTTGAVVPKANVVIVSPATGFRREMAAGANGGYSVPGLPIGTYNITVSHSGFETAELKELTLSVGQVRTFDVRLGIGAVTTQ